MARARLSLIVIVAVLAALAAAAVTALLVNIFQRKTEARSPFYRVVELTDDTVDPAVWGKNFPQQYDGYRRTVDQVRTRYGGSEALRARRRRPIRAWWSHSPSSRRIRGS
jgi:nitrite reductase (cytochrome c-552)